MSYQHLKDRPYYEDIYDRITVDWARRNVARFMEFRQKWFDMNEDKDESSFRNAFYLNFFYMIIVGDELLNRYDKREAYIHDMMAGDEAKDQQIAAARLTHEPVCAHCGKTGLHIVDKSLMHREGIDSPEQVIFMLKCTHCDKNSAYWEGGSKLNHRQEHCPKCQAAMEEKTTRKPKTIITTYICPSCRHSFTDKLDLSIKKDKPDPNFEADRELFCLHSQKSLEEHRDAKRRYEGLAQLGKELKEKEDNKDLYDAIAELKKLKIAELSPLLVPALEKAGYIEFSLDKPEIGKDVTVGFNCLDNKSDRQDYDSQATLKKLVGTTLKGTNWRLMTDGISYRLGYLSGRLRAYEHEEDLVKLMSRTKKPKSE